MQTCMLSCVVNCTCTNVCITVFILQFLNIIFCMIICSIICRIAGRYFANFLLIAVHSSTYNKLQDIVYVYIQINLHGKKIHSIILWLFIVLFSDSLPLYYSMNAGANLACFHPLIQWPDIMQILLGSHRKIPWRSCNWVLNALQSYRWWGDACAPTGSDCMSAMGLFDETRAIFAWRLATVLKDENMLNSQ